MADHFCRNSGHLAGFPDLHGTLAALPVDLTMMGRCTTGFKPKGTTSWTPMIPAIGTTVALVVSNIPSRPLPMT
jgi:hypothetical protein